MSKIKFNYRHIICWLITLGFVACTIFLFPTAFTRIIEAGRDFGLSIAYYFVTLMELDITITPTVTGFTSCNITPFFPIAEDWAQFQVDWTNYWARFATIENFTAYLSWLSGGLLIVCNILLFLLPLFLTFFLLSRLMRKTTNNDYNKDTLPLKVYKAVLKFTYAPVKKWVLEFIDFVKEHDFYLHIWGWIWAFNFNFITILVELFAYYFYLVCSFDLVSIYTQVYKLLIDLSPMVLFIPLWAWVVLIVIFLDITSKKMAHGTLLHRERRNRGFINERGVVTIAYGDMGAGKTAFITDMALSAEVELRDMALEVILECDMKFPNFPWINLENALKSAIADHTVYDVWSCRRWLRDNLRVWQETPTQENIFDYDFKHYGLEYDDKLKLTDIWSVLEDYACAYLVYTVQSSLIISNYSIRTDNLVDDLGNFPLRDSDFFDRDSRLLDSFSRHSHILDFDMLRLGKKMLQDNPNRNAYGFGVYVVTEIDKERKNTPSLQEVKATADECNQKNDLFNVILKMSRHAVVIAHRVFVKIIGDLQRPESLGADARELGTVVYIDGQTGLAPCLPFFSPFWLFELIYTKLKSDFDDFYLSYRYRRGDNSLFLFLAKNFMAILEHNHKRTYNLYGSEKLLLEVERGKMDGTPLSRVYFRQSKKIWAKRYSTDCLSGIFEARAELNKIGVDDLREYADIMATNDELLYQNSHFQKELSCFREVK